MKEGMVKWLFVIIYDYLLLLMIIDNYLLLFVIIDDYWWLKGGFLSEILKIISMKRDHGSIFRFVSIFS